MGKRPKCCIIDRDDEAQIAALALLEGNDPNEEVKKAHKFGWCVEKVEKIPGKDYEHEEVEEGVYRDRLIAALSSGPPLPCLLHREIWADRIILALLLGGMPKREVAGLCRKRPCEVEALQLRSGLQAMSPEGLPPCGRDRIIAALVRGGIPTAEVALMLDKVGESISQRQIQRILAACPSASALPARKATRQAA